MEIGSRLGKGSISPYELDDVLRVELGPSGNGYYGWTYLLTQNYGNLSGMQ